MTPRFFLSLNLLWVQFFSVKRNCRFTQLTKLKMKKVPVDRGVAVNEWFCSPFQYSASCSVRQTALRSKQNKQTTGLSHDKMIALHTSLNYQARGKWEIAFLQDETMIECMKITYDQELSRRRCKDFRGFSFTFKKFHSLIRLYR